MKRPTFLILGAPKCGTTTLHHVLSRHPDVFMAPDKDPRFFELDEEYAQGVGAYWDRHFAEWRGEPAVGEARPTKLMLPWVPERVARTLPDARLIAILRDPADRLFSHWWMRRVNGLEPREIAEALDENTAAIAAGRTFEGETGAAAWRDHLSAATPTAPVYLEFGYYPAQLTRWFGRFPREQILILFFDDLARDPVAVFRELFAFLGVDPARLPVGREVHNAARSRLGLRLHQIDRRFGLSECVPAGFARGAKRLVSAAGPPPRLDPAIRARLVAHYTPHVRALEGLTGRELVSWRTR